MTYKQVVEKFEKNKAYLRQGAGYLGNRWDCSIETINKAKKEARKNAGIFYKKVPVNKKEERELEPKVVSSNINKTTGEATKVIESSRPLSPKEIDELVGVDNINTFVDQIYDKSKRGMSQWDYTVRIKCLINDFYTKDELQKRLEEIFPAQRPVLIPGILSFGKKKVDEETLIIYISDIHAGAVVSELSLFGNKYNETVLHKRLMKVIDEAVALGKSFKNVYIVNLGDSLDGWDGFTVKRKHTLGSQSNKAQFDIYTKAMSDFYQRLFQTKLGENYKVWNCLNANHDGNGLSYIANQAVKMFLDGRFPDVKYIQQEAFIDTMEIGNHVFAFTHGKDAELMKFPMTKNLTDKLDAWLFQYFSFKRYNSYEQFLHVRKGDLHCYNQEYGKFGDYLNVPSIYGSSDYIELNYSDSKAGALLEVVNESKRGTTTIPIFFEKD